jgi:aminodeoxyfutalosine deaminase
MKIRKITADCIYPVSEPPIQNGVVIVDENGKILALDRRKNHDAASLEIYPGVLIPGFVNTHCHLELSHMKSVVATGTGLIPFIKGVVTKRGNFSASIIKSAIEKAEKEMLDGGIVAVGDISNAPDTFETKSHGRLRYYTFLELFDFLQENNAESTFLAGQSVFEKLNLHPNSRATFAPHAPYSVSKNLFRRITAANPSENATISIHNQETPPENELFMQKTGGFVDFYGGFGISLDAFSATKKSAIFYALENLNPKNRTIFVHNTLTTKSEIEAAQAWSPNVFWASCPNANLYIENRLPNYQMFLDTNAQVTLGTDSLTSNWQLSILEEMKTITRFQSYVTFENLLKWATLNGAKALGFEDTLGSFEVGKTPAILLLNLKKDQRLRPETRVKRLI